MSKVSKNQKAKKPEANKERLDERNWQAAGNGGHTLLFANSEEEAINLGKTILGIKKDQPIIVKPYGTKNN